MIRSSVMVSAMNGASKSNLIAWSVQCLSRRFLNVLMLVAFITEGGGGGWGGWGGGGGGGWGV